MIKQYTKKDGSKAYLFVAYLGIDPVTGKEKRTTRRGFKSEREAKLAEAKLQTTIQDRGFLSEAPITYQQVYELWLEGYKNTVRESTLNRVTQLFSTIILPKFGYARVNKITPPYCQQAINEWSKRYANVPSLRAYASRVLEYAVTMKMIRDNPFKATKASKREKAIDDKLLYYSAEELQTFLGYVEHNIMHYTMFRTLAFTGLRRGELFALTWQDINFETSQLTVNKTTATGNNFKSIIQPPKTKSSLRTIDLDPLTLVTLSRWRKCQREEWLKKGFNTNSETQLVFSSPIHNGLLSLDYLNHTIKQVCKAHDFKRIKIHGFRHTHCSLLFESGATVQEVQSRLGHSDIQTTMNIYAHVTEKQRTRLAEKFANYVNF